MKGLKMIVQLFVGFRYDNCRRSFEVVWPMPQIDTSISDVDDVAKTIILFENGFEMIPQQLVWSWHRQVIALVDCMFEFFLGKWIPKCCQFIADFVKDFNVDLLMKCSVKREMESIPQTIKSEVWLIIVFDSLNSGEFSFVDPIHKLLGASTLVCYLLNLVIEEGFFGDLDYFFEYLPGF